MAPLAHASEQRLPAKIIKAPWTVTSDGRTPNQIARDLERRGRFITDNALEVICRATDLAAPGTVYSFWVIRGRDFSSLPRPTSEIFELAARAGLKCQHSIIPALLLAEKYTQRELGCQTLVMCHAPISIPRPSNPSQRRTFFLSATESEGQEELAVRRPDRVRLFGPGMSFVFFALRGV